MIMFLLYIISAIAAFYLNVKYFTRQGVDVEVDMVFLILLVSLIPLVGILTGLVSYATTLNCPTLDLEFFKGEKKK